MNIDGMKNDLGSREMVAKATEMHWYPSEVDVSIRRDGSITHRKTVR